MKTDEIEKLAMRSARSDRERLVAAINSTADDLHVTNDFRVIITGKTADGDIIYLGEIPEDVLYMMSRDQAAALIEKARSQLHGLSRTRY